MKVNYEDFVDTICIICKKDIELFDEYDDINSLPVCKKCCEGLNLK